MSRKIKFIGLIMAASMLLSGCMLTVEQMYRLPKRSEDYNDLQSEIDKVMPGLEFCAPLSGENQQTVQSADLDGDNIPEYLLFAKGSTDRPLRILIFRQSGDTYTHTQTIESNGSGFDQVEYVQMDDRPGVEMVVGSQLADQVLRSVSVYTFNGNMEAELLVSVNYIKFLTVDLDEDQFSELFVLRPGQTDTDNGVAEAYGIEHGTMERSNEVNMSQPAEQLKRLLVGRLHDGYAAVYAASMVDETTLVTDVYTCKDGLLSNVTFSNDSGTSVKTMRNYYVYADDIDSDGVVELPDLINMKTLEDRPFPDRHDLIRWYAMTSSGEEIDKKYTYHNFVGGWYMELDEDVASRLTVISQGGEYKFYLWNESFERSEMVMTVYVLAGQSRMEQSELEDRFVLMKNDTVIYSASLTSNAEDYGITQQKVIDSFHLIQQDWKTGET